MFFYILYRCGLYVNKHIPGQTFWKFTHRIQLLINHNPDPGAKKNLNPFRNTIYSCESGSAKLFSTRLFHYRWRSGIRSWKRWRSNFRRRNKFRRPWRLALLLVCEWILSAWSFTGSVSLRTKIYDILRFTIYGQACKQNCTLFSEVFCLSNI